jgi:hypothetical protein
VIAKTVLTLSCLTGAVASYLVYQKDREHRAPVREFAAEYAMPLRRPDVANSLRYAPSADFAADLVADATLRDVLAPVNLNDVAPAVRAAWIDAVPRYDAQIRDAAGLTLDAIALRPGWPYHASLLGRLTFTADRRSFAPALVDDYQRWAKPLHAAATDAAADDSLWQFLALSYLQTWPDLGRNFERSAPAVFRRAFEDSNFVHHALTPAMDIIGGAATLSYLPESPRPLRTAWWQLSRAGDADSAWMIHRRWERAEWDARNADLRLIERASNRGDLERTRSLCYAWAYAHPAADYDSSAAHVQVIRVLELWPPGIQGSWMSDPRGKLIRYLLARRVTTKSKGPLTASADLHPVPAAAQAEIALIAGDFEESWKIATAAADFGLSNSWTPYLLAAVRHLTDAGDTSTAATVYDRLPSMARNSCTAAAMQSLLGRSSPSSESPSEVELRMNAPSSLCATANRKATYVLPAVERTTMADVMYDSARRTTLQLQPGVVQRVAFEHAPGAHTLLVRPAVP